MGSPEEGDPDETQMTFLIAGDSSGSSHELSKDQQASLEAIEKAEKLAFTDNGAELKRLLVDSDLPAPMRRRPPLEEP